MIYDIYDDENQDINEDGKDNEKVQLDCADRHDYSITCFTSVGNILKAKYKL